HRSGRTARAGASGTVVSLVEPAGTRDAKALGRQIGIDVRVTAPDAKRLSAATPAPPVARPSTRTPAAPAPAAAAPNVGPKVADVALFAPSEALGARQVSTVTFFHVRRGYGFIDGGEGPDVFVHHTNVPHTGGLTTGQRVEFAVRAGKKGPEAIDVVAV
ncbi:MAG: cold shock domain-containing protein, partial [Ilumatobacteraceae bacterium]